MEQLVEQLKEVPFLMYVAGLVFVGYLATKMISLYLSKGPQDK